MYILYKYVSQLFRPVKYMFGLQLYILNVKILKCDKNNTQLNKLRILILKEIVVQEKGNSANV